MKKIIFVLAVVLLASPAWAVDIECTVDGCDVTVSFSGAVDIRAFAVDIQLDGNGEIGDVQCLSAAYGYQIYPGDIDIDSQGNVDDWGSCKCSGSYAGTYDDSNAMTIEAGSLYEDTDPDPCNDGNMVSFRVSGNDTINVSLSVNPIRGGVVNEAANEVTPVITNCQVVLPSSECMMGTHPDYAIWGTRGKPDCWCYHKQCEGDEDGLSEGPFWVSLNDLNAFRPCLNQMTPPAGCECSDFDHASEGPFMVSLADLNVLRPNLNQMMVDECDGTHINFWTN